MEGKKTREAHVLEVVGEGDLAPYSSGPWPLARGVYFFFFLSKARASIHSENSRLQSSAAASNSLELLPMAPAAQVRDGPCLFLLTPDRNSEGLDVNRIACDFWRIRGREIIETGSTPGQWIS